MVNTSILTKLKSGIRRLVAAPVKKQEWPFQDEKMNWDIAERQVKRMSAAVIDVEAKVMPELLAIPFSRIDNSNQSFQSNIYRNRLEQMYERLRKANKKTFTLEEAQALSGLETDLRASVSHLVDKGFVKKTGHKRYSKIYSGKPGRPATGNRLHEEYTFVRNTWYVGQRTGPGSQYVW